MQTVFQKVFGLASFGGVKLYSIQKFRLLKYKVGTTVASSVILLKQERRDKPFVRLSGSGRQYCELD